MSTSFGRRFGTLQAGRAFTLAIFAAFLGSCGLEAAEGEADILLINPKTGVVWHKRPDAPKEVHVDPRLPLYVQDTIRTDTNSTAVVLVRHKDRLVRLWELSTLKILPPENDSSPWLNLLRGALYLFSREKSNEVRIRTPHATGAPTGTEFVVMVESNQTLLVMLDGTAAFTNLWGATNLQSGDIGIARTGAPPIKISIQATNIVQWWLYYPGVLDLDGLKFTIEEAKSLSASTSAYRSGDLRTALLLYPGYPSPPEPATDSARVYLAALYLAAGQAGKVEDLLKKLATQSSEAGSLRWMMRAVQGKTDEVPEVNTSASECLGLSYYYQARHELEKALDAARNAVVLSTNFAFAWVRVAELEFGFGRTHRADEALTNGLSRAPRNAQAHALAGFLFSAKNRMRQAEAAFDEAIRLDSSLGNAWLGRGLVRIRKGNLDAGRMDLQMAAILEPNRSLLRSYLGKAYGNAGEQEKASLEFHRASQLDTNDPTAFLYSALLLQERSRVNEAITNLEHSIDLNDNRRLYRSRLLLDQDRAVRSANLATIYLDAGMTDVSVREASRAVSYDYANYSSHLFLANSYNALRDLKQINLRYETAWLSEFLVANLLSPVGGGQLSQSVSHQEYSKLFERDRLGIVSSTDYLSHGEWFQTTVQHGTYRDSSYAVESFYHSSPGSRPNNDLSQLALNVRLKQQLTSKDTLFAQIGYYDAETGDVNQYYFQNNFIPGYRSKETQEPSLLLGGHHEWNPSHHTIWLAGRLDNRQEIFNPFHFVYWLQRRADTLELIEASRVFNRLQYISELEIYTSELQHIWHQPGQALQLGVRYQAGEFETRNAHSSFFRPPEESQFLPAPLPEQEFETDFERFSAYGYYQCRVALDLWLVAGVSYDSVLFPINYRYAPITDGTDRIDRVSPKGGFIWTPADHTTVRGAYSSSLGGVSLDQSYRLEPSQVAGFNQAFRSLIPETVEGANAAPTLESWNISFEQKLGNRTYLGISAGLFRSEVDRTVGVVETGPIGPPGPITPLGDYPATTHQTLDYRERFAAASLYHLVGDWSFGARYTFSLAELKKRLPDIPAAATLDFVQRTQNEEATLHGVNLFVIYNHPSGFFAQWESSWNSQANRGYENPRPGGDFWQFDVFAGYRFLRRKIEARLGVLNLTDQDYRLNPLNMTTELPRERTLLASLKFSF